MKDKLILANYVYELAKSSHNEFIEVAEDSELKKIAAKFNIVIPSPDIAILKTDYAEINKSNLNGIRLPKKDVEEGLPTIVGKQANWNHEGSGFICGYILDGQLNGDMITIYTAIFKSVWQDEFDKVKARFQNNTLTVSFEIWNRNEKGESVLHEQADGTRSISPIIFHGVGILIDGQKPACPKARAKKLLAALKKDSDNPYIVDSISNQSENLVYAELGEEFQCKKCSQCTCDNKKEDKKVMSLEEFLKLFASETEDSIIASIEDYEGDLSELEQKMIDEVEGNDIEEAKKLNTQTRNDLKDSDFAVVVTVKNKKTGEPRKIRMFPIHDPAHIRNALSRLPQAAAKLKKLGVSQEEVKKKILKRAKQLKMTELVDKHKAEMANIDEEISYEATTMEELEQAAAPKEVMSRVKELMKEGKTMPEALKQAWKEYKAKASEDANKKKCTVCGELLADNYNEDICAPCKDKKQQEQSKEVAHDAPVVPEGNTVNNEPRYLAKHIEDTNTTVTTDYDKDGNATVAKKGTIKKTRRYSDMVDEVETSSFDVVDTFTKAQVDEQVALAKEEIQKVVTQKDTEIAILKEEISKKDKEVDNLKIEKAKLEKPEVEKQKKVLTVGSLNRDGIEAAQEMQKKITEKAFGKRK